MSLYLVQHGRSLPKTVDPDPGLSPEGLAEVERIAGVARGYGVRVRAIVHSGKTRALQTAAIMGAALIPPEGVQPREGLKPLDDVTALAAWVDTAEDLMLVGHLPFMERLTAWLTTGSAERPVFRFQNGGIVCLRKVPETAHWVIVWALMPRID
jgi:phosphohistidine phosphatase